GEGGVEELDGGGDGSSGPATKGDSQVADVYVINGQCRITEVSRACIGVVGNHHDRGCAESNFGEVTNRSAVNGIGIAGVDGEINRLGGSGRDRALDLGANGKWTETKAGDRATRHLLSLVGQGAHAGELSVLRTDVRMAHVKFFAVDNVLNVQRQWLTRRQEANEVFVCHPNQTSRKQPRS